MRRFLLRLHRRESSCRDLMKSYGKILRELRERADYGQVQVAHLMQERGQNVTNTHVSRWENGYNNPTVEQFVLLCAIYGVRDPHKVFVEEDLSGVQPGLNRKGIELLTDYRDLLANSGWFSEDDAANETAERLSSPELHTPAGLRDALENTKDTSHKSGSAGSQGGTLEHPPQREIPVYTVGPSSRARNPLEDAIFDMMPLAAAAPQHADFAVHVDTNSMEPLFEHGGLAYVQRQRNLNDGEFGVVALHGDAYVKQLRSGSGGTRWLLSANPAYAPIEVREADPFTVYGRIIHPLADPDEAVWTQHIGSSVGAPRNRAASETLSASAAGTIMRRVDG